MGIRVERPKSPERSEAVAAYEEALSDALQATQFSVVQCHQIFSSFFFWGGGFPTESGLPQKGLPFFPRWSLNN